MVKTRQTRLIPY